MVNIGKKIKAARQEKGISQEELAQSIGATKSAVSRYEAGKREPSFDQLQRISEALNVSITFLVGASDEKRRLLPEHLLFNSPNEEEIVKSILPHLSELDPLSNEESALKVLLNSAGYDLLKADGIYFFMYKDGGSTVPESDINELLSCTQNGLTLAAKTLELKLRQEAYQAFGAEFQPPATPQSPPPPQEGKDPTPPPDGSEGPPEGE